VRSSVRSFTEVDESTLRDKIRERISYEPNLQLLFLESFCNDPAVIAANVALKVQSGDPDYQGMSREEAERDFKRRIAAYESVYQTITEPRISFCRILNVGQQVSMNRIQGYLQSRVAFYLMNLHLKPRSIYLSRVGVDVLYLSEADWLFCSFSMARACTMLRERSVAIRIYHHEERIMLEHCLHW